MSSKAVTITWRSILVTMWSLVAFEATTVDLQNQNLSFVPTSAFAYVTRLIKLSNNAIHRIEDYDFANLPELQTLKIENNFIDYVSKQAFVNSTGVTNLYFSGNQLACVCDLAFPDLPLETVILDYNPINETRPEDFQGFSSLKRLSLRETSLKEYPNFTYIAHTLTSLTLNKNNFDAADDTLLATARNVNQLALLSCSLTRIPDFSKFPTHNEIWSLDLDNRGLGPTLNATNFNNLPNLKEVAIEYSKLVEFPDFGSAKNTLKVIRLKKNSISAVEVSRLQGFLVLRELYVSFNLIASFPYVDTLVGYTFGSLQRLDLQKNPLACDSTTLWIGFTLAEGAIGSFLVVDPCLGLNYREVKPQQSSLFVRVSSGNIAGGDDLSVCVSQCMLEPTCAAVSFQPGTGCTLEQRQPGISTPAGQEWWLNNM